jgi:flagellar biosynthesis/type III secretory pathway protein FliH
MTLETALIVGLVVAIVWLAYEYIQIHHKLKRKERANEKSLANIQIRSSKIIEKARLSAAKILKEARIGAAATRKKLSQKMDSAIAAVANEEVDNFKDALRQETVEVEKLVGEKVAQRYDAVSREIEDYRQKKLTEVEDKIVTLLEAVGQKVFGRSIPVDQHLELVRKSLEEAKRDGMFN